MHFVKQEEGISPSHHDARATSPARGSPIPSKFSKFDKHLNELKNYIQDTNAESLYLQYMEARTQKIQKGIIHLSFTLDLTKMGRKYENFLSYFVDKFYRIYKFFNAIVFAVLMDFEIPHGRNRPLSPEDIYVHPIIKNCINGLSAKKFKKLSLQNSEALFKGRLLGIQEAKVLKIPSSKSFLYQRKFKPGCNCELIYEERIRSNYNIIKVFKKHGRHLEQKESSHFFNHWHIERCRICGSPLEQERESDIYITCQEIILSVAGLEISTWITDQASFGEYVQIGDRLSVTGFCFADIELGGGKLQYVFVVLNVEKVYKHLNPILSTGNTGLTSANLERYNHHERENLECKLVDYISQLTRISGSEHIPEPIHIEIDGEIFNYQSLSAQFSTLKWLLGGKRRELMGEFRSDWQLEYFALSSIVLELVTELRDYDNNPMARAHNMGLKPHNYTEYSQQTKSISEVRGQDAGKLGGISGGLNILVAVDDTLSVLTLFEELERNIEGGINLLYLNIRMKFEDIRRTMRCFQHGIIIVQNFDLTKLTDQLLITRILNEKNAIAKDASLWVIIDTTHFTKSPSRSGLVNRPLLEPYPQLISGFDVLLDYTTISHGQHNAIPIQMDFYIGEYILQEAMSDGHKPKYERKRQEFFGEYQRCTCSECKISLDGDIGSQIAHLCQQYFVNRRKGAGNGEGLANKSILRLIKLGTVNYYIRKYLTSSTQGLCNAVYNFELDRLALIDFFMGVMFNEESIVNSTGTATAHSFSGKMPLQLLSKPYKTPFYISDGEGNVTYYTKNVKNEGKKNRKTSPFGRSMNNKGVGGYENNKYCELGGSNHDSAIPQSICPLSTAKFCQDEEFCAFYNQFMEFCNLDDDSE